MSEDLAVYLSKQLLWQALCICSPVVFVAVICGLLISILQAVTQIQDSTLSTVTKILAVALMLMFCGHWMLGSVVSFAENMISNIPERLK
ncbi:flagellar biosynthetic protein FliQ [Legionella quinlivanii]|uniref:Flagellar biosynthetic protein FliQ n=1 Tax=Legionella quinlivanii TaxID=45073 RepID=A0A0W0XL14_9GAMM|nr:MULTISPECIES: flagellar biosynthesis protein FliQ [Legionella]KTD45361.1 flagellar biosynthetic protein FliQ [Legionella quinlivanii]MCE3044291.1 flagellar biosynthesis protein FliQ [Legionella sp. 16cNR16C]SEG15030.1 flagellar biosynthetic protein FliQ [Legionella quinlivanii DSM 21216]STY10383.1 flagellar biosynthetic protein FliQ [Legionella quinlivanii]